MNIDKYCQIKPTSLNPKTGHYIYITSFVRTTSIALRDMI